MQCTPFCRLRAFHCSASSEPIATASTVGSSPISERPHQESHHLFVRLKSKQKQQRRLMCPFSRPESAVSIANGSEWAVTVEKRKKRKEAWINTTACSGLFNSCPHFRAAEKTCRCSLLLVVYSFLMILLIAIVPNYPPPPLKEGVFICVKL